MNKEEVKKIYPSLFDCRHLKPKGEGYWQVEYISLDHLKKWINENLITDSITEFINVKGLLKYLNEP